MEDSNTVVRNLQFRGLARLDLTKLNFTHASGSAAHGLRERNVRRLVQIFRIEGCHRHEDNNFIDGIVSNAILEGALAEKSVSLETTPPQDWSEIPHLTLSVDCLNGRHRAAAAARFLDENDKWWIVRLFTNDLPAEECTKIAESYVNEQAFTDGNIFYCIRLYHGQTDKTGENRWWARLSETKRKDLRQLLKDQRYAQAFDSMLEWPGLWAPIRLGSLHRLLTMKCDEEAINYLTHVATTWRAITSEVPVSSEGIVDEQTVNLLETLAPYHAGVDADLINSLMESGKIFPKVSSPQHRAHILHNTISVRHMIPSLFTFFENLKYLEPCAKIMRQLLPSRQSKSIRGLTAAFYFPPKDVHVQYGANDTRIHDSTSYMVDQEIAYHQLWLFAMRHFPEMTNTTTKKDTNGPKPIVTTPNPALWQEFGALALALGFQTEAARELAEQDGEQLLATQIVARSDVDDAHVKQAVNQIARILKAVKNCKRIEGGVEVIDDDWLSRERRCGRPFQDDHFHDKYDLFLPKMYAAADAQSDKVTTLFCKRDMFQAFFGICNLPVINFTTPSSRQQSGEQIPTFEGESLDCQQCHVREAAIQASTQNNETLKVEIAEQQRTIEGLEGKIQQQDINFQQERSRCEDNATSIRSRLEAREKELSSANDDLRTKLEAVEKEREQLLSSSSASSSQTRERLDQLQLEKDRLSEQLKGKDLLSEQLKDATSTNDRLKKTMTSLNATNADMQATLDNMANESDKIQSDLRQKLKDAMAANADVEKDLTSLRATNSNLQTALDNQKTELDNIAALNSDLQTEVETRVTEIDSLSANLSKLQDDRNEERNLLDQQATEISQLHQQVQGLEERNQQIEENLEWMEDQRHDAEVLQQNAQVFNKIKVHELEVKVLDAQAQAIDDRKLLTDTLAELEDARQDYQCIKASQSPRQELLVLRWVSFRSGTILLKDQTFTRDGGLKKLQVSEESLKKCQFYVGLERKIVSPIDRTAGYLYHAWCAKTFLWVTTDQFIVEFMEYFKQHPTFGYDKLQKHDLIGDGDDSDTSQPTKKRKRSRRGPAYRQGALPAPTTPRALLLGPDDNALVSINQEGENVP